MSTPTPVFSSGTRIFIPSEWPEDSGPCHIRTPAYVRGKYGHVVRHLGAFDNPEDLAFGRPATLSNLYHVCFDLSELWPADGHRKSEAMVEIFEHWMEKAEEKK
jgi:hypothetical protein